MSYAYFFLTKLKKRVQISRMAQFVTFEYFFRIFRTFEYYFRIFRVALTRVNPK